MADDGCTGAANVLDESKAGPFDLVSPSSQFLAQNTHPYTPLEKGRKALLEHLSQRR
jgi:hypothetical protein